MRHLWQVFHYELKRNSRRKGYLFMTFGLPLIALVLVLGYQVISKAGINLNPTPNSSVPGLHGVDLKGIQKAGYVDLSGLFPDPGDLSPVLTRYADETAARAALDAAQIDLYYLIPADYLQTGKITAVMPQLNLGQVDQTYIQRLTLQGLASDVTDQKLLARLTDPSNIQEISVRSAAPQGIARNAGSAELVVYLFGIILMISMFVTNGYLMQSVIEEKETRLIEILISTVRPVELLSGKILALGLLGLSQMVVWFTSFILIVRYVAASQYGPELDALARAAVPVNMLPLMLVYFVLGYLLFAACYSIVGALSSSLREGPQYAVLFTLPAALPFYFLWLFVEAPDSTLPTILSLFPLTSPLSMIQRLAASPDTIPVWQIGLSLMLLVLSVLGLMWLAGRLFRVQTLLAGQTPKLKDLPRLVRG